MIYPLCVILCQQKIELDNLLVTCLIAGAKTSAKSAAKEGRFILFTVSEVSVQRSEEAEQGSPG